jgi:hypothetical protein
VPHLFGHVEYAEDLHAWEPAGLDLVAFTQDNALLDAHRAILAAEFPRRKFETGLAITVGGLRADTGTYYTGSQRPEGFAKLAALQEAHKLGVVNGWHLISKRFDRDDHSRDESTYVNVEACFARPQWPEARSTARVSVQVYGPFGDRHLDLLVGAAWATFRHLVNAAPVRTANASWDSQDDQWLRAGDDWPVAAFMLIEGPVVGALGGGPSAAERLGAFGWEAVRGDERNGVVVQLGRRPEDTSGEHLARIRAVLGKRQPSS